MCTNRKEIVTCSGRKLFINCGHCPACQQQKANRNTFRIRSEVAETKDISLFITLTYQNKYIPYVRKSDIDKYEGVFPIYRDFNLMRVRHSWKAPCTRIYDYDFSKRSWIRLSEDNSRPSFGSHVLYYAVEDKHEGCIDYTVPYYSDMIEFCPTIRGQRRDTSFFNLPDKVGVLYYPDLQNFFKRLNINYSRLYNENPTYSFFGVGEYGPKTKRPHFHICLTIPHDKIDEYIQAIVKSWQYSSEKRLRKYIEVAKDVSSYVSSYVNTSTSLPPFYFTKEIRPKCSHSKHYGFNRTAFSLPEIEKKISVGDLSFNYDVITKSSSHVVERFIPTYVLSFWFPKIQGFSKLSSDELVEIYSRPSRLSRYARQLNYDTDEHLPIYDDFGYHRIATKLRSFNLRMLDYVYDFESDTGFYDNELKIVRSSVLHRNIVMLKSARYRYYKEFSIYPKAVEISDSDLYGLYFEAQEKAISDCRYLSVMSIIDDWIKEREALYLSFAQSAIRCWKVYASNLLRSSYDIPIESRYENAYLFYESKCDTYPVRGKARFPSMPYVKYELDVNNNSYNNMINFRLIDKFTRYDKSKKVTNSILCESHYDF